MIIIVKKFDYIVQIIMLLIIVMIRKKKCNYNYDFYANCNLYFNSLRKSNKSDHGFEDEFYCTLPSLNKF